jgi:hypothetical protein
MRSPLTSHKKALISRTTKQSEEMISRGKQPANLPAKGDIQLGGREAPASRSRAVSGSGAAKDSASSRAIDNQMRGMGNRNSMRVIKNGVEIDQDQLRSGTTRRESAFSLEKETKQESKEDSAEAPAVGRRARRGGIRATAALAAELRKKEKPEE